MRMGMDDMNDIDDVENYGGNDNNEYMDMNSHSPLSPLSAPASVSSSVARAQAREGLARAERNALKQRKRELKKLIQQKAGELEASRKWECACMVAFLCILLALGLGTYLIHANVEGMRAAAARARGDVVDGDNQNGGNGGTGAGNNNDDGDLIDEEWLRKLTEPSDEDRKELDERAKARKAEEDAAIAEAERKAKEAAEAAEAAALAEAE